MWVIYLRLGLRQDHREVTISSANIYRLRASPPGKDRENQREWMVRPGGKGPHTEPILPLNLAGWPGFAGPGFVMRVPALGRRPAIRHNFPRKRGVGLVLTGVSCAAFKVQGVIGGGCFGADLKSGPGDAKGEPGSPGDGHPGDSSEIVSKESSRRIGRVASRGRWRLRETHRMAQLRAQGIAFQVFSLGGLLVAKCPQGSGAGPGASAHLRCWCPGPHSRGAIGHGHSVPP